MDSQDRDDKLTMSRRDMVKTMGVAAAGVAAGSVPLAAVAAQAAEPGATPATGLPQNPYGGKPNTGITLPPYYRPTPSVANANTFFPGMEELGDNEMRISFIGSTPVPPTRSQAGTCIMVELGNDKRFFFDFGNGALKNLVAMQVPIQVVNDIFFTHLHVDHYADLPYLYAFAPWILRKGALGGMAIKGGGCGDPLCDHKNQQCDNHTDSFSTWSYETGQPVSLAALREAVARLPVNVYWAKGIIYSQETPERRAVLQVVGKRVDISLADGWNGRPPRTQIVAIGAPEGIDPQILQQQFDACIGQPMAADA